MPDVEGEQQEVERKKGFHLPPWAWKLLHSIAYALIVAVAGAGWGIYRDNIESKKDIARETWRNDQQDARDDRLENRVENIEANQDEFHREALRGINEILEQIQRERHERRRR